jgi:hypothetical protein
MKVLQLTSTARARVWFGGGVPEFSPSGSVKTAVEGEPSVLIAMPHVTLEAIVPRGARAEYGLLGVRFDTAADTVLRIEVPYSNGAGSSWSESLGAAIDDVRLGLPREYAQAILDAAAAYVKRRFPPGAISFVEAAHGIVGSNARFFKGLAMCALELMQDERHGGDEQTARLLRKHLVEQHA